MDTAERLQTYCSARVLNIVYVLVCSVIPWVFGLSVGGPALASHARIRQDVAHYHSQCPVLSISPGGSARCPEVNARVIAHYAEGTGKTAIYWIGIQVFRHEHFNVNIDDATIWSRISVGETIVAQVWQGRITGLSINSRIIKTYDNPDLISGGNDAAMLLTGMCAAVGIAFVLGPMLITGINTRQFKSSMVMTWIGLLIGAALKLMM